MAKRRVVVTGLGMISPIGLSVDESWQNCINGKSGIKLVTEFDVSKFSAKIAGRVKNFDAEKYLSPKEIRKLDTFVQYAVAVGDDALADSKLEVTEDNAGRVGVAIGSGIGGLPMISDNYTALVTHGPRRLSPFFIPGAIINMASGYVSIKHGLKGPNIAVVTACTTAAHNIGMAARMISYGDADVMVAGGAEMATCPLGLGGFAAMRALSTRNDAPEKASRPWDRDRDGFVLAEGAGALVLEDYEHAKKRGAKIYAELAGFGMSADAHHISAPDENGFIACMQNALKDAGMSADAVDYINAHGTSTPVGDVTESSAVKKTFGDHAYQLAVSSTKSMTGHLLGAAGAVEAIFSVLAIRDNIAPPTINLDNPAEGCDLNYVANEAQSRKIDVSLSNSFGFGGTNGSIIFKRCEE
ncbi:MAG: beta-ketoacyl-[acyl-carrier-protein] synthase II [Legionellales bacterium]|nr:beta-ketoacyl-[acyl-carrier-protein] synthase II [Legionellales bacterium]